MWVISNDSLFLIICYVKGKNKLCCIIISYCEFKIKWINIVLELKMIKSDLTVEDRYTGKMIIIHGINDNILISHPSNSCVYQDEAKNEISTKR